MEYFSKENMIIYPVNFTDVGCLFKNISNKLEMCNNNMDINKIY